MKRARSRLGLLLVLGMLTALLPVGALAPAGAATINDVIINEVDADQVGTDALEFIELYDGGDGNTLLDGLTVVFYNGNGDASYSAFDLDGYSTDADGYFLLGNSGVVPTPSIVFGGNFLQNGPDAVALYADDATTFPNGTLVTTANLVDAIVYDTSDADDPGLLVLLNALEPQVNESGGVSSVDDSNQRCPNGSGGAQNTSTYAQWSPTPGSVNSCTAPSTPPTGTGTATPPAVDPGATTLLEVAVVPGQNPTSASYTITADLTEIDGIAAQPLLDDGTNGDVAAGDNTFSYLASVGTAVTIGAKSIEVTITDDVPRTGSITIGLTVGTPPVPAVYISEFHYDNAWTDVGEFVEVTGEAGTDLTGWTLVLYNGNGGGSYNTIDLAATIGDEGSGLGALDYQLPVNGLQNGSPDGVALVDNNGLVVEFLSYEGTMTATDGPANGMVSVALPVSESSSTAVGESLQTLSDTGDPDEWFGPEIASPGVVNTPPPPPLIVINEIMQNPAAVSDSNGEWLELYNPNSTEVDIDGWTLADSDSDTHTIDNGGPLVIPAGGYIVLGSNANTDTNGGVTVGYEYSSFFLANGDDEAILADTFGSESDRVEYDGGPIFPDPAGASMSLENPANDNNLGTNWCTATIAYGDGDLGTPGSFNYCPVVPTRIHDIQGSTDTSPLGGTGVTVEGIVVGDFQGDTTFGYQLNGYFVQEEDADVDGDAATSEGMFVYDPGGVADVALGDLVRATGTVAEYVSFDSDGNPSSLTQLGYLSNVTIINSGNVLPTATDVALPLPSDPDYLEQLEGMSVVFGQDLYISEYFNFDRFNEIVVTSDPRPMQPTAVFDPGSPEAAALADHNVRSRITLDDGRTASNPDPARHPNGDVFDLTNTFRGGDQLTNVQGVISDTFGFYRIQPTNAPTYTALNPRALAPDAVGGTLTVASFNVLNYFTTFGSRGADNQDEFDRQRTKIIAAIAAVNADVVGLMEIENNDAAIADLVSGLNALMGTDTYASVDTGVIGTDEIKVAFIYKPASVSLTGTHAILDSTVDVRFDDTKNRPALAQTFTELANGESVTVVVNHLKSKGSSCGPGDDDPEAGSCNLTRTLAAEAMVDWLANPAYGFDSDVLIIGDLNSYDKEDPIDALVAGGYSDLMYQLLGEDAYSYLFSGQWGYLDYAMANAALQSAVTGTTVWHINADEPDLLDYDTSFKQDAQDALYEPNAFRASDHDPVIVGLDLAQPQVDKGVVRDTLEALPPSDDKNTNKRIEKAVDATDASLNVAWWLDDQTINTKKVFDEERKAVVQLELVVASGVPEASTAQYAIDVLVNADRQLARIAIISATTAGGNAAKLAQAESAMADAAALVAAGRYNEAINAYKRAWDMANKA